MENEEDVRILLVLNERLSNEREAIGWLCTSYWNIVHYEGNPSRTKEVHEQLNKAGGLISLAYIWALLEENGFDEHNKWITSSDRLELKAWKHIRHTGAHAPGGRAKRYFQEFNEFMESDITGISLLKQNCKYTETSIDLNRSINYNFFQFIEKLIQKAVGYSANNITPA